VEVRPATIDDARAIADIHVRAWRAAYRGVVPDAYLDGLEVDARAVKWRANLERATSSTWIASDADMVLGWMSFASSRDDDASATTGELWAIYIDPDHWRRGVGQALWEVGATQLRAAGFRDCTLWVLRDNPAAQAFYAAHGFVVDPGTEKVFELGGAAIAEIRMRATLHP